MGSQQHLRGQKAIDADLGICQLQVAGRFIVAMVGANLGPQVTDCGLRQPGPPLTVAANVPEIRSHPRYPDSTYWGIPESSVQKGISVSIR